jgi:hypothetical protein
MSVICRNGCHNQAASNYQFYDPNSGRFLALLPEQAMVFANEESPVYMIGGFDLMASTLENQPKVEAAFKSGGGVAWGDQAGGMFCASPAFSSQAITTISSRPGCRRLKLEAGARVGDTAVGAVGPPC